RSEYTMIPGRQDPDRIRADQDSTRGVHGLHELLLEGLALRAGLAEPRGEYDEGPRALVVGERPHCLWHAPRGDREDRQLHLRQLPHIAVAEDAGDGLLS